MIWGTFIIPFLFFVLSTLFESVLEITYPNVEFSMLLDEAVIVIA
jgi:hypothetical protein